MTYYNTQGCIVFYVIMCFEFHHLLQQHTIMPFCYHRDLCDDEKSWIFIFIRMQLPDWDPAWDLSTVSVNTTDMNICLICNKKITKIVHPCEKVIGIFFRHKFFIIYFFVVCSSFYTWYMWGCQYQFCKFLLDCDHSDILKKVTGSKPDVALVWFMQWAKMELEHGEKDRYWCIVNSVGGSYESITDFRKPLVTHKSID